MKELNKFECQEIYGGGDLWKKFGRAWGKFLNAIEESQLKYYSAGTYPGHLNNW